MRDRQVVVRIDQETYDRLASYATDTERVMSQVIRLAIKEFLLPQDAPSMSEFIGKLAPPRPGESYSDWGKRITPNEEGSEGDPG